MAQSSTAISVAELVRAPIEELGFVLWDVRYVKEGASWYLRIYIDSPDGISIDNCSDVSHLVDPILDEHDIISQSYFLEVCSPGLERELINPEHFEQMCGCKVKVKLIRPINGIREFAGTLKSYDGNVTIDTENGEITFLRQSSCLFASMIVFNIKYFSIRRSNGRWLSK